jgi:putative oxidoreductase
MLQNILRFEFFKAREDYGVVFLRLLIGVFIIWGVADNIFSWAHMVEFQKFLGARGVPYPLFAAHLSAYAQFICGLSILLGAFVRLTSIVFIINFTAAIVIAHLGHTFQQMFPALMMIVAGLFFLFHGAGPLSVDATLEKRKVANA